jgi:hypothetical protein
VNLSCFRAKGLAAAVALIGFTAAASATTVHLSGFSLTPGAGYGTDANEGSGTQLGVTFSSSAFIPQSFSLTNVGDVSQFALGLLTFAEPNSHGALTAAEVDGLDVGATLAVSAPFASTLNFAGSVAASTGAVSDAAVDLAITWNSIQVAFGNGGLVSVALNDLVFKDHGALALNATMTLLRSEQALASAIAIPEPSGALLIGAALLSAGALRRRKI